MTTPLLAPERRLSVSAFVLSAVILIVLVLLGLARTQGWFEKTIPLQFVADSAADLRTGMQVRLFGISVGKVKKISLREDGRVLVDLGVNDDYRQFLHLDTQATLAREGLFGDSYIVLESAHNGSGNLAEHAQIPFDAGTSLGDLVTQLSERLFPLLDELTEFAHQLNAPDGNLQASLREMKNLLVELHQTRLQMDKALKQTEWLMSQRIPATLEKSDKMLADFSQFATNLDQRMARVSAQLDQTLKQFEQTGSNATKSTEELNKLLQEMRPSLQKTLQEANELINNANQTVTNMQTHWPFTPEN